MSQYVIRSNIGRILTHTNDLKFAFEFSRHWAESMSAPCTVENRQNGQTVYIDNRGLVKITRAHIR